MKVFGQDIESTGVKEDSNMIELAFLPVDHKTRTVEESLLFHRLIKCPSFEELKPELSDWVIEHNQELIEKAHREGCSLAELRADFEEYLNSDAVKEYFGDQPKIIFGKSLNGIDMPFLTRDLGWDFMRKHFYHQTLDLSTSVMDAINKGLLPAECLSGSKLTKFLLEGKDEVDHRAIADIMDTNKLYWAVEDLYKKAGLKL
jgi:oligoribonuclease (3'-5' exoribonuclease)